MKANISVNSSIQDGTTGTEPTSLEETAPENLESANPLERLGSVVELGVENLYRDSNLLRALAELAVSDPAEFACHRDQLRRSGIKMRELDRVISPLAQQIRAERPALDAAECYRVSGGRIVRDVATREGGTFEVPLATWHGRVVEEVVRDDGADRSFALVVEGALADGTPLARIEVPADEWPLMRWPVKLWGTRAVVLAGASTADHLRCALQLLSGDVAQRIVYGHTGWRHIAGRCVYLHASGAIGADGAVEGISVSLPEALAGFCLPEPLQGHSLVEAVRASLRILDVAPDRISVPILGAVYRSVLRAADFAVHLAGPSGLGKSELAALAQQHFGPGLDARHLPGSWLSTANALEGIAFSAAHAILTVDDFNPRGSTADIARMHREADRLLRAQGNHAGRQRMRADSTLRAAKPPRGLILSTGEDVPRGQSLRARMLVLELGPGELSWTNLTLCQSDAATGRYAAALAGYLRWLAPRYSSVHNNLQSDVFALRARAHAEGLHARTPGIVADLCIGWKHWLDFAVDCGAIDNVERNTVAHRVWRAMAEAASAQREHVCAADPVDFFLRLLLAALASGIAHVASTEGVDPSDAPSWGWRLHTFGIEPNQSTEWRPQGKRIGWVDGENIYLEPEVTFAVAAGLARDQGDSLALTTRTLHMRLNERGFLVTTEKNREVLTIRKILEGKRRSVLHVLVRTLFPNQHDQVVPTASNPEPDRSDVRNGRCGRVGRV